MGDEREPEEGGGLPPHEGADPGRGSATPAEPTPEDATAARAELDEGLAAEGGGVPRVDAADVPWEPPLADPRPGPEAVAKEDDPGPDA